MMTPNPKQVKGFGLVWCIGGYRLSNSQGHIKAVKRGHRGHRGRLDRWGICQRDGGRTLGLDLVDKIPSTGLALKCVLKSGARVPWHSHHSLL